MSCKCSPDPEPQASGRFSKWFRSLRQNQLTNSEAKRRNQKWMERFAFCYAVVMSCVIFVYGSFVVLPKILKGHDLLVQIFVYIFATWCAFGFWAHFLLIVYRDTSIRKMNLVKAEPPSGPDVPKLECDEWHICPECKVWVPPLAWHCTSCQTCILCRDHHCVFVMTCIGQNNQINFLGFLMYLTIGSTFAFAVTIVYINQILNTTFLAFLWSVGLGFFTLFIYSAFDLDKFLFPFMFSAFHVSWAMFGYYFFLALANQTAADFSRRIRRSISTTRRFSYANLQQFFGKNPLTRIIWPFYPLPKRNENENDDMNKNLIDLNNRSALANS